MPHPDNPFCPDHQRVWDAISKTNDSVSKLYATTAVQKSRLERVESDMAGSSRQGFSIRMALFAAVLSVCSSIAAAVVIGLILRQ